MKIGVVTHAYYPRFGGVSEHVAALAHHMRLRGHELTILTGHVAGEDPCETGIVRLAPTYLLPHNGAQFDVTLSPWLPARLHAALRDGQFDVVHVHEPFIPVLGLLTLSLAPCPVVGTFHASAQRNRGYALFRHPLRAFANRLAVGIAVSEAARAFVARYVPADYEVVPNGVDTTRFAPRVTPQLGARRGRPLLLFVGRLDPRKGLGVLIEALALVRRTVPEAELLIVGDGPLRERFRRQALPLGDAVRFEGAVPREALPHYYAAADIVVSPALGNESFGIVLLEAMASGRALVASDIAGYRSVVTSGHDGVLVPPENPAALAAALTALVQDPERRALLGHQGRRTALRYDWSVVADRIEAAYARAAGQPVPRRATIATRVTDHADGSRGESAVEWAGKRVPVSPSLSSHDAPQPVGAGAASALSGHL